jgi:hypothetical protein
MMPDDESVRRAMQKIEPGGADSPDLFERVAVGARRRRRQRSVGAVSAAAVVVAVVALVPALGRGSSSTKVQPIGTTGPLVSPAVTSLASANEHPSSPVSPSAPASSVLAVNSPSPPLSSTPPTPPLITAGACAGLSVAVTHGDPPPPPGVVDGLDLVTSELQAEPSLNLVTVGAGSGVSFQASGPAACVNRVALSADAGTFPTDTPSARPGESGSLPLVVHADGPGVEHVDVLLRPCAEAAKCDGGQLLATTVIAVDPPATSTADPVSSNLGACPTVLPLEPGVDAAAQARAAAVKVVPTIYPPEPTKDFTVTAVYPASQSLNGGKGIGTIAYGTCGKTIGDRTWVVEVHFPRDPNNSASTGNGQLFVSEFANGGWQVWLRNH